MQQIYNQSLSYWAYYLQASEKKEVGRFNGILYILPHRFVQFVPTFQFQVLYNPVKLTCKCLHITHEAPLSALKSAIAENSMGVTSRP